MHYSSRNIADNKRTDFCDPRKIGGLHVLPTGAVGGVQWVIPGANVTKLPGLTLIIVVPITYRHNGGREWVGLWA